MPEQYKAIVQPGSVEDTAGAEQAPPLPPAKPGPAELRAIMNMIAMRAEQGGQSLGGKQAASVDPATAVAPHQVEAPEAPPAPTGDAININERIGNPFGGAPPQPQGLGSVLNGILGKK